MAALDDLLTWFETGGEVGIYDATNAERGRRDIIRDRCEADGVSVLFVETMCNDPRIIDANIRRNKLGLPDYAGMSAEEAFRDLQARIAQYARAYVPVGNDEGSYVKLVDAGRQIISSQVEGYLASRLVFFLMQVRPTDRPIWLTRHGGSEFNVVGRIGGDAALTAHGKDYAELVASFVRARAARPVVCTSTLQQAIATAAPLAPTRKPGEPSTRSMRESAKGSPTRRSARRCPTSFPRGRATSSATVIPAASRMRT